VSNQKKVCFERFGKRNGDDERVEEESKGRENWVPTNVETLISIHGEMDEDFMKNVKNKVH
jgi:hypothetical protein